MEIVNVHQAKTHLSRLLKRVEEGAEIVIARGGRPIARLVPLAPRARRRTLGADHQTVRIADTFDAPLSNDVLIDFEE